MPYVDYNEWYRREQDRIARTKGVKPMGTSGYEPYQGYRPESRKEQQKELTKTGKEALQGAAQGAAKGASFGPKGAVVGGAIGTAVGASKGLAKGVREAWDAAKAGDSQSFYRNLAPTAGVALAIPGVNAAAPFLASIMGLGLIPGKILPEKYNPATIPVKIIAELFGGPRTRIEEKRWERLKQAGFDVPKWVEEGKDIKDSGFRQDLAPDFVGKDAEGNWVNNIFAKSRNEADLTAEDVNQYAVMPETFGTLWRDSDEQSKFQVANLARENNLLREHHGTLDINWTPELMRQAQDILASSVAQNPEQAKRMRWSPLKKDEGWQPLR
jgi:hypothetical protein